MTVLTKFAICLALACLAAGCAGSGRMRDQIESYEPPPYLMKKDDFSFAAATPESPGLQKPVGAVARPAGEKSPLVEVLESNGSENVFLVIDPALKKKLENTAADEQAVKRLLKDRIVLDELKALVLLRNPRIRAAESRVRAELESFTQVANLDEILRQYTAFTEGLMIGVGPVKGMEPMSTQFPFPGVTALKGQVVQKAVQAARENLEIARRDAVTEIARVFWELAYAEKARSVASDTLGLLKNLEDVADARYRSGKTSFQDIVMIRIRAAILEENLTTLNETERNLEAKIIELLNLSPKTALGRTERIKPPEHTPPLDSLYVRARENRQEIKRLEAEVGKMERMIEMTETMVYPTYTLGFSFYGDDAIETTGTGAMKSPFSTATAAGMGAGLPKSPWYGVDDPWLRQTRMKLEAMRQELQNTLSVTANMVRNAWFAMDKAIREHALYRDRIIDLSRSALDVSTQGYESGTVSFADVIGSHTTWLEVNLAAARKSSDVGIAKAALENAVGTRLE